MRLLSPLSRTCRSGFAHRQRVEGHRGLHVRPVRTSRRANSSSSSNADSAAQQREILKTVHDATTFAEVADALLEKDGLLHAALDVETSLDSLCYVAGNVNDGLLVARSRVDAKVLDGLSRSLIEAMDLEMLRATENAQLVWVMETVERVVVDFEGREGLSTRQGGERQGVESRWTLQVMKAIAERMKLEQQAEISTRDLTNLALSICQTPLFASSAPVIRFLIVVLDELISRIAKPHIRSAFSMRELGMLAAALATVHGMPETGGEARGALEAFLTRLWVDGAEPKLSNRHSQVSADGSGKGLEELRRFLVSYVRVFRDEPPERMLESVASFLTRMLKSDVATTTTITCADLAALLEFFAYYQSRRGSPSSSPSSSRSSSAAMMMPPITVVELASVTGASIRQQTLVDETEDAERELEAIASLLRSHVALNLRPAEETLLSLVPYVRRLHSATEQGGGALASILGSFEIFGFDPGRSLSSL